METRETRIAKGRGRFVDDLEFPNMAHLVFVGSSVGHAVIKKIDTEKAKRAPGVLKVMTGHDVTGLMDPLPPQGRVQELMDLMGWIWRTPTVYPLAVDKVRWYGEPIAAVVAEDETAAREAAGLVEAEYDALPFIGDVRQAMEPDSPRVYDEWESNVQAHITVPSGDVAAAFSEADRVIPVSYAEGRASGFSLEPRGCVAWYRRDQETLTVWGGYQSPFLVRYLLAESLRIPYAQIKVNSVDIGGAFGNKIHAWKDHVAALASKLTGRPVKWSELQREWMATGPHQRDVIWEGEVAVKNDGRVLGMKARVIHDLGVEGSNKGVGALGFMAVCASVCNAYHWKGMLIESMGVVTNKSFYCAYRGYAKDKGIKFTEYVMNAVARELGLLPEEVRLVNFIQPDEFPYRQINNYTYDSGDYPAVMKKALDLADVRSWREKRESLRSRGVNLGVGVVFTVEPASIAASGAPLGVGSSEVRIRMSPDGTVELFSDWTDLGQGATTSQMLIVSEILGCPPENVVVRTVSSDMIGTGSISSRGAVTCASAVARAANLLKDKIFRFAGAYLGESPENLETTGGAVFPKQDRGKRMSFKEIAEKTYYFPGPLGLPPDLLQDRDFMLDVSTGWFSPSAAINRSTYTTFCAAADIAVVDVDADTGETRILEYVHVHDAGRVISREIVDGQLHGGIVQGIGEALYEEVRYGEDGRLISGSYADYAMPTILDAPDIIIGHVETPSPYTELGTKGMGESPIISSKIVMLAAIEDALAPLGVRGGVLPATRERVRHWVKTAVNAEVGS